MPKEELSEEEQSKLEEEKRKANERKDRPHQNYLKRKANGKQQEYEGRYKEKRKQKKQEKLKVLKRAGILMKDYKNKESFEKNVQKLHTLNLCFIILG